VAHDVASLVVTAEHLPAVSTDRFVGGDAGQLLRGRVPGDDGEVGVEGEQSVSRPKRRGRSLNHGPSLAPDGSAHIRKQSRSLDG
jgi:hypothetical protein